MFAVDRRGREVCALLVEGMNVEAIFPAPGAGLERPLTLAGPAPAGSFALLLGCS
jgi:hypothetical protein